MDIPTWLIDVLGDIDLGTVIVWVVLVVLAYVGLRKAWPGLKAIVNAADLWSKLPGFMASTDNEMKEQSKKLDGIYHETHKNDGSSIKDATVRLEATAARLEESSNGVHGRLDQVEAALVTINQKLLRDHDRLNKIEDTLPKEQVAAIVERADAAADV